MSDDMENTKKDMTNMMTQKTYISKRKFGAYVLFSCVMFLFFIVTGYWTAQADPTAGDQVYTMFQEMVVAGVISESAVIMALQIFINNVQICALIFLGGATFGLLTVFLLMTNGIVIGVLIEVLLRDMSKTALMIGLLPHGIFEIPAVLVSAALGMIVARGLFEEFAGRGNALNSARAAGWLFVTYVVPFIFIAACVEAFITPFVMGMMQI
ncbi:MAG: stage II sporulation protein M [Euryarchaeota archaeon]|nr:stage II sporulation protein M [Euryarchaeota archaeon]